jgi:hypothetical protein
VGRLVLPRQERERCCTRLRHADPGPSSHLKPPAVCSLVPQPPREAVLQCLPSAVAHSPEGLSRVPRGGVRQVTAAAGSRGGLDRPRLAGGPAARSRISVHGAAPAGVGGIGTPSPPSVVMDCDQPEHDLVQVRYWDGEIQPLLRRSATSSG